MSSNKISLPSKLGSASPSPAVKSTISLPLSFPQHLQSESGQKAIMSRLESEIRLLENLRKFLQSQIKAGREYSLALGNASTSAMKNLTDPSHPTESTTDGVVTKVCLHILEEVQSAAVTVKENSDFLQTTTLVHLNELILEKKNLLKLSREEYEKIRSKLEVYKTEVGKSHEAYLKTFTGYEAARTKYEENCAKTFPKGE